MFVLPSPLLRVSDPDHLTFLGQGCGPTAPSAAEPSVSTASSQSSLSRSPTTTGKAGNGSLGNGSNGRNAEENDGGGGGGGCDGGDRPPQRRSRRQQEQQEKEEEHRQQQEQRQWRQKEWKPKPLLKKDVKTARAQLKTTAKRIKFVKVSKHWCFVRVLFSTGTRRLSAKVCLVNLAVLRFFSRSGETGAENVHIRLVGFCFFSLPGRANKKSDSPHGIVARITRPHMAWYCCLREEWGYLAPPAQNDRGHD